MMKIKNTDFKTMYLIIGKHITFI